MGFNFISVNIFSSNFLMTVLDDFNINNQLCQSIMREGGVYEYYDMERVFEIRAEK